MHQPQQHHWKTVKPLLRYLVGSITHGLQLTPSSSYSIKGFSDGDWGSNLDGRKYTIGYYVYLSNNIISWNSHKQKVVSRSNTEPNYRSIATVLFEIIWISSLLLNFIFLLLFQLFTQII